MTDKETPSNKALACMASQVIAILATHIVCGHEGMFPLIVYLGTVAAASFTLGVIDATVERSRR